MFQQNQNFAIPFLINGYFATIQLIFYKIGKFKNKKGV